MYHHTDSNLPIYIIGAGIAGIACAKTLQAAGKKVILLEAKSCLGGRIASHQDGVDCFDLGASWIHGITDNPIWALTQHYAIETCVFNYDKSVYLHPYGQVFSSKQTEEFEFYLKKIEKLMLLSSATSARAALHDIMASLDLSASCFSESELKKLLVDYFQHIANDPFATELECLPANYAAYEGYFQGDEVIFKQGYAQVIAHLAQDLDVKTDCPIQTIVAEPHHLRLIDHQHNSYFAAAVVVAVPLGVLKKQRIQFKPELPSHYQYALQNIGFGSFNKVFFELEQPLGFDRASSDVAHSIYYWTEHGCFNLLDLSELYNKPVYLMLFGGRISEFIDQATDNAVWHYILTSLKTQIQQIPRLNKLLVTRWGADSCSDGAFSFPSLQHSQEHVRLLQQPINGRIYFAGEHCSLTYAGTVHGAYLSGTDTAQQLLMHEANRLGGAAH